MKINVYDGDLPDTLKFGNSVAIDCETLGLKIHRDRLCLVQLTFGDGVVHLVQFKNSLYNAPNLCRLLQQDSIVKIFHYARFDVAVLQHYLGVMTFPVYCTKIASKLTRTYTDKHSLKNLVEEMLNIDILKKQQSSDWAADTLTEAQIHYAANDVVHLHALKIKLDYFLDRQGRWDMANAVFRFLPVRATLDLAGWEDVDIFSHG